MMFNALLATISRFSLQPIRGSRFSETTKVHMRQWLQGRAYATIMAAGKSGLRTQPRPGYHSNSGKISVRSCPHQDDYSYSSQIFYEIGGCYASSSQTRGSQQYDVGCGTDQLDADESTCSMTIEDLVYLVIFYFDKRLPCHLSEQRGIKKKDGIK